MKKLRFLIAILMTVMMGLSGVGLDGFAALSYAADDQGNVTASEQQQGGDAFAEDDSELETLAEDVETVEEVQEEVIEEETGDADAAELVYQKLKAGKVKLGGLMPDGAEVTATDASDSKAVRKLESKDEIALAAYDITIQAEGAEFQPDEDNPILVQISNKAIKENSDLEIWHILDDGTKEQVEDFAIEDGKVIFEANGFSVYVIIEHEEDDEVVTPRVEFHYISPNYTEDNSIYTAPAYQFVNKHQEKQVSQILTDGESLEKITNPPNKTVEITDDTTNETTTEEIFFYGWYTANMVSDNTEYTDDGWTGEIKYTWPEPQKVNDGTSISITYEGTPQVDSEVTWSIGDATGTAVLDAEGTAHVYLVPMYEHYHFVNFRMGALMMKMKACATIC